MRVAVYLLDCQEGCSVRSFFSLAFSHWIGQHWAARAACVSQVDWLQDEPLSCLSSFTRPADARSDVYRSSLCRLFCYTTPQPHHSGDKPVTAGRAWRALHARCLLSHLLPLYILFLCQAIHSHRSEPPWGLAVRLWWCCCATACTKYLSELVLMWTVMHLFHFRCLLYL